LEECVDVRQSEGQVAASITRAQLTSSDEDETVRYRECRRLAKVVVASGFLGIVYPSAAATWSDAWNLVLFEAASPGRWASGPATKVPLPELSAAQVKFL
jgi:hypothetical protein